MSGDWQVLSEPIPICLYNLTPGTQIRVRYLGGLASDPKEVVEEFLVGHINNLGGLCDDCTLEYQKDCVVVAERIIIPGNEL